MRPGQPVEHIRAGFSRLIGHQNLQDRDDDIPVFDRRSAPAQEPALLRADLGGDCSEDGTDHDVGGFLLGEASVSAERLP